LLAGALLEIATLVRSRWSGWVMLAAAGAAVTAMLLMAHQLPATAIALDWRPVTLFGSAVSLRVDETTWLLGLALSLVGAPVALAWTDDSTPSGLSRMPGLLILAASLSSVFAANLLTLALCWGLLDASYCLMMLASGDSTRGRHVQLALGLNGLATLAVWTVAVLAQRDHLSPYWHLLILPSTARLLMGLAAALRLGLYPLHALHGQPVKSVDEPAQAILIYLIPPMAGLALWVRLIAIQGWPEGNLWLILALVTAFMGGALAWIQSDTHKSSPYLALGCGGMLMAAATTGQVPATALAAGAASWLLGLALLFVGRPISRAHWPLAIPTIVGAASLAGLPLTIGFVNRAALYKALSTEPMWIFIFAVAAEILLVGAMLQFLLRPDDKPALPDVKSSIGYVATLAVTAAPLIFLALVPTSAIAPAPRLNGAALAGWGAPLVGGAALAALRMVKKVRERLKVLVDRLANLEWLYTFCLGMTRSLANIGLWIADLLEGDGAFLWMLLILALALLYLRRT